jgi:alpha-beta hydrolase superfamily lysophospholipase
VTALHPDADMAGQLDRTIIGAYVGAADVGEAIATATGVAAGDYDGWFDAWAAAAERASEAGGRLLAEGREDLSARAYMRASEYWRQSNFFLRQDLDDKRLQSSYTAHRDAFRAAMPGMPAEVEAVAIPYKPVAMPGYMFRPKGLRDARPTVLIPNGFDSTAEELHKYGVYAALALGWNVLVWDSPGTGAMLVEHRVPMRPDFENVVGPVVDWLVAQPSVDPDAIVLVGRSLGGYLVPRAASGEKRIAAIVADPGQFDLVSRMRVSFNDDDWAKVLAADEAMDAQLQTTLDGPRSQSFYGSRMAAMGASTYGEWVRMLVPYTLEGRADSIDCPTLITEGEGDFASQSDTLFAALTCEKELRKLSAKDGCSGHVCGLGQQRWQQEAFGWLASVLEARRG